MAQSDQFPLFIHLWLYNGVSRQEIGPSFVSGKRSVFQDMSVFIGDYAINGTVCSHSRVVEQYRIAYFRALGYLYSAEQD